MTIHCDDMATYYDLRQKQRQAQVKYGDQEPDPAQVTVQELALLQHEVQPPPLQVVVDFWLSELVHVLKS